MSQRTFSTDGPKCPYCGFTFTPDEASYYDEHRYREETCQECEKTFDVVVCHSTEWVTRRRRIDRVVNSGETAMRVLVCGGRGYDDVETVYRELDRLHDDRPIACIIEGGAMGADYLACRWSAARGLNDHVRFSADWAIHGRAAGPLRNRRMIDEGKPDLVIAFPGGRGTADMIRQAEAAGIEVRRIGITNGRD